MASKLEAAAEPAAKVKVEFHESQCLVCGVDVGDDDAAEASSHVTADEILVNSRRSVREFLLRYSVVHAKVIAWDATVCSECFSLLTESDSLSVKFENSLRIMKEKHVDFYGAPPAPAENSSAAANSGQDPISGVTIINGEMPDLDEDRSESFDFSAFPAPIVEVAEQETFQAPVKRGRGRPRKNAEPPPPILAREERKRRKPKRLKMIIGKVKKEKKTNACKHCGDVFPVADKEEKAAFREHKRQCCRDDEESEAELEPEPDRGPGQGQGQGQDVGMDDSGPVSPSGSAGPDEDDSPPSPDSLPSPPDSPDSAEVRPTRGRPRLKSKMGGAGGGVDEAKLTCKQCGFKASKMSGLKTHLATRHPPKPVTCRFCPEEFPSRQKKSKHEKEVHPEEAAASNSLFCDCCGKTFKTPASLKIHRGEYRYDYSGICEVCGEFAKNVKVHMSTKHREPPKCEICGLVCSNYHSRKAHLYRAHGVGKKKTRNKYKCPDCPKDFWSKPKMIRHRVMRHNFRPDAEYIFTCEFCQKEFYCKDTWREHRNGHLGITPYECPLCGYATNIDSNLHIHMRQVHKMRLSVAKAAVRQRQAEAAGLKTENPANADDSNASASASVSGAAAQEHQLPPQPAPQENQEPHHHHHHHHQQQQPQQQQPPPPPQQQHHQHTPQHHREEQQQQVQQNPLPLIGSPDDSRQSVFPGVFPMNMVHIPTHPPPSVADSVSSLSQDSCDANPEYLPGPNAAEMAHNAMMMRALGGV